jgi:hypothetical protein
MSGQPGPQATHLLNSKFKSQNSKVTCIVEKVKIQNDMQSDSVSWGSLSNKKAPRIIREARYGRSVKKLNFRVVVPEGIRSKPVF